MRAGEGLILGDGPVVTVTDVTFRRGEHEILRGVSFALGRGEHWAMIGPNGAGKSTILKMCGAQIHPTSGTVEVLGHRLGRVELQALRRHIGHVDPRHPLQSALTVREVVLTGFPATIELPLRWRPSPQEVARADRLIADLGLAARAEDRWPTLSQGERGRALIARALAPAPRLLLLDEPGTGLDVAAREQLIETVDRLGALDPSLTTVLVTHHLEELPPTTTHALLVSRGLVTAAGPVASVLTTPLVSAAFDHPIEVEQRHGRWTARTATHPDLVGA